MVLFFEILLVIAVVVITLMSAYILYRFLHDES